MINNVKEVQEGWHFYYYLASDIQNLLPFYYSFHFSIIILSLLLVVFRAFSLVLSWSCLGLVFGLVFGLVLVKNNVFLSKFTFDKMPWNTPQNPYKTRKSLIFQRLLNSKWSGKQDLNLQLLHPKCSALPNWTIPR